MSAYELAQLNIAAMKEPLESPVMTDFVANLDRINKLAENSQGYVWRLESDEGDATQFRPMGDKMLINITVWRDVESLRAFVYRSSHVDVMRRRREWFERLTEAYTVLWWVPRGHRPEFREAEDRLMHLRRHGPDRYAFDFRESFPSPDAAGTESATPSNDRCPAC